MRKLTAADHQIMPWKNGGGVTTQLAVFPRGAGLDAFDWRISTAKVASEGPFSRFEGIDRSLAVIRGHGLVLTDAGGNAWKLDEGAAPFVFRGEQGIAAQLNNGPVIDFNVMTRRSACSHLLDVVALHGTQRFIPHGDLMLVHVAEGRIACRDMQVAPEESIIVDWREDPDIALTALSPAILCVAHISFKEERDDRTAP